MGDVEIPPLVKQIVRGLRGLAFLATILATSFMACSHERAIFPFDYKADYTDLMLFKYVTTTYISFLVFYYFVVCFWSMHALSNLYKNIIYDFQGLFGCKHCRKPLQLFLCMPSSEELALAIGYSFRCGN